MRGINSPCGTLASSEGKMYFVLHLKMKDDRQCHCQTDKKCSRKRWIALRPVDFHRLCPVLSQIPSQDTGDIRRKALRLHRQGKGNTDCTDIPRTARVLKYDLFLHGKTF